MRNNHGERLARLESDAAQKQKEIERLFEKARAAEALRPDVEKLLAWKDKSNARVRQCARVALWLAALTLAQQASGPWSRALEGVAKQLARGLG